MIYAYSEFQQQRLETTDDAINKLTEDENYKLWIGKDYTNFIIKDFVDLDRPFDGKEFPTRYRGFIEFVTDLYVNE